MKKLSIVLLVAIAIFTTSCSGVWMNPTYSELLDKTVINAQDSAQKAKDGKLTKEQMVKELDKYARIWEKFQDARDGKK